MNWETAERALGRTLVAGLWFVPVVALLGAFLLALGYDEAWYLTDVRALVESGVYGGDEVGAAWTSGGLYTALVALLSAVSDGELWVVRLVSVGSMAALLLLVVRWGAALHGTRMEGALMAVWIVALPGTLTFAGTAYATLLATTLVLGAAFAWSHFSAGSATRRVSVGLLIGLAIATRWNCVFALPALGAAALTGVGDRRPEIVDSLVAGSLSGVVGGGLILVLVVMSDVALDVYGVNVGATGYGAMLLDYPRQLNKWILSQDFLSLPLMVAATVVWVWATRQRGLRGLDFVPWFAWLLWFGWLAITFVGHLRYLWPSLAAFAVMLGYGLGALHRHGRELGDTRVRVVALSVGVACLAAGYASTLRAYVHGSNDVMSWEWSGYSAKVFPYRKFEHVAHQRAAAIELEILLGPGDEAAAIGEPLQLAYLARREVRGLRWYVRNGEWLEPERLPRIVVVTPDIGGYHVLSPAAIGWFGANTELRASYGGFAIYEVVGKYPDDPDLFIPLPPPAPPPLVAHPGAAWLGTMKDDGARSKRAGAP